MPGPDLRRSLVRRLLSCLGAGQIPWLPHAGFPANVFDRRRYEGDAALALLSEAHRRGYTSPYWGSQPQWEYLGGRVWGEPVAFLPWGGTRPVEVYNLDAVAGDFPASRAGRPAPDYAKADRLIAATGADIRYSDEPRAAYHPAGDFIVLPHPWRFRTPDAFYGTACHELAHWTEPAGRLGWYDGRVAVQELRAELASDFLLAELGLGPVPLALRANVDKYAGAWSECLSASPGLAFATARAACRAVDFLLGFAGRVAPRHADAEDEQTYAG
jgi:antirestriction protein ArdC